MKYNDLAKQLIQDIEAYTKWENDIHEELQGTTYTIFPKNTTEGLRQYLAAKYREFSQRIDRIPEEPDNSFESKFDHQLKVCSSLNVLVQMNGLLSAILPALTKAEEIKLRNIKRK